MKLADMKEFVLHIMLLLKYFDSVFFYGDILHTGRFTLSNLILHCILNSIKLTLINVKVERISNRNYDIFNIKNVN